MGFLYSSCGYFIVFQIQKYNIRKEVYKKIKSDFVSINAVEIEYTYSNISEFTWIKKCKEFVYRNAMYDVVKAEKIENGFRLYCLKDDKEKELHNKLENHITETLNKNSAKQKNKKTNNAKQLHDFLKEDSYELIASYVDCMSYNTSSFIIPESVIPVKAPPPEPEFLQA